MDKAMDRQTVFIKCHINACVWKEMRLYDMNDRHINRLIDRKAYNG